MSLILEALRKSEAERRRGQAPDLLTEPMVAMPGPAAHRARTLHWAHALAAAVFVAGLAWWFWPRTDTARAEATRVDATSVLRTADAGVASNTERMGVEAARSRATSRPAAASTPIDSRRTVAGTAPASAAPPRSAAAASPVERNAPASPLEGNVIEAAASRDPREADVSTPASKDDVRSDAPRTSLSGARASTDGAVASAPVRNEGSVAAPAPPPAASPSGFSRPEQPLRLSDLSGEERQALPPLKMSMHMFGIEPAQRFAIIDGNRVGEGDRIGETRVEAIDRTGVTLAWRGRRIRLPIR